MEAPLDLRKNSEYALTLLPFRDRPMIDGARAALLGYLYQFVGVASLRAVSTSLGSSADSGLLADVRGGVLVHEKFGQDAVVRKQLGTTDELVAVQFKHSGDPKNEFTVRGLIEVLHGLEMSRRAAEANGETVSRYVLITNRSPAADAQKLLSQKGGPRRPTELLLGAAQAGKGSRGRASSGTPGPRKPHKWAAKVLAAYTNAIAAADAWWLILKGFTADFNVTFDAGWDGLREWATAHGVLPCDLDASGNRLVGALTTQTAAGPVDISEDWLKEHLLGAGRVASLAFPPRHSPHIAERCRHRLADHMRRTTSLQVGQIVRRDVQSRIATEALQSPVVFVYGGGGVGKSTETVRFLTDAAGEQVAIHLRAEVTTPAAVGVEFHRLWRDATSAGTAEQPVAEVEARLATANPRRQNLMTVAVDGADEVAHDPDRLGDVRSLLECFWAGGDRAQARLTLLVTCRARPGATGTGIDHLVETWLGCENPAAFRGQFGLVSVGDFDDEELIEAATQRSPEPATPERRLIDELRSRGLPASPRRMQATPIREDVIDSLRHPAVWGVYAELDTGARAGVLNGEAVASDALAREFVRRFLGKCERRGSASRAPSLEFLTCVASATQGPPPFARSANWTAHAGVVDRAEAGFLYNEALDYGLIAAESPTTWRWRHRFAADYLRRGASDGR